MMINLKGILLGSLLLIPAICCAEPTVIYDAGNTRDISNYLYPFAGPKELKEAILKKRIIKTPEQLRAEYEKAKKKLAEKRLKNTQTKDLNKGTNPLFPIDPGGLVLGKLTPRSANFPELKKPLCIFGSDKKSLRWFDQIKYDIQDAGGFCWLIQADNLDDLKRVLKHSKGIVRVIPISGKLAAKQFGLERYPAIITSEEITQ